MSFEEFTSTYKQKKKCMESARRLFPLRPSKELAQLAAALMTDGHIDWRESDDNPRPTKLILYSNYKNECRWFLDLVYRLFSVKGRIVQYTSPSGFSEKPSFKAMIYSAQLARIFIKLGVPCGDKTNKAYLVPHWIINGNREIKSAFLRIMFNFDGSLSLKRQRQISFVLSFSMNKQKNHLRNAAFFVEQIKEMLRQFGISAGKIHIRHCRRDKFTLILFVTNSRSILNFHKYVGFLNKKKCAKLKFAVARINTYRRIKGVSHFLTQLKQKIGTDRETVRKISALSKLSYTPRQFEHMRRGESHVPVDMLSTVLKLLGKENPDVLEFIGSREH